MGLGICNVTTQRDFFSCERRMLVSVVYNVKAKLNNYIKVEFFIREVVEENIYARLCTTT